MDWQFNIHSLRFFIIPLVYFSTAIFVLLKNNRSIVNRSFFILALSASIWQLAYFIAYNLNSVSGILFWHKIGNAGLIFTSPALYNFVVSFLHLRKNKMVYVFYAVSFILCVVIFYTDYIAAGARVFPWGNVVVAGKAYILLPVLANLPPLLALKCLYAEYRKAESPYDKRRIKYFMLTLPIVFLSVADALPSYGFKIYPFGFIPLIIFALAAAYAILRYRILDIEIIVKKASLIIFGFVIAMSLVYLGTFYLRPHFYSFLGSNWIILPIFIALLVGCSLFYFINFVRQIEEEELSKRFAYRPILRKEAKRIFEVNDIHELITYVVRDLSNWMRLDYAGVYILDMQSKEFVLSKKVIRSKDKKSSDLAKAFSRDNSLVKLLIEGRIPLIQSEMRYYLDTKSVPGEARDLLSGAAEEMHKVGAEIAVPSFCEDELLAVITLGHKINLNEVVTGEDLEVINFMSNNLARALNSFKLKMEKTRLIVASQNTIISAIEAKDSYTRGHTDRVAHYTALIAKRLQASITGLLQDLSSINWSAQLHDVGKIALPDSILFKPGPLSDEEWERVREHPLSGVKIIAPVQEWLGEDICAGIAQHHENYDGSGYPFHKKGADIHMFARIIRVADSFDAMMSQRPYRKPLTKEEAMQELVRYKGVYFDPEIVKIMQDLYSAGELEAV